LVFNKATKAISAYEKAQSVLAKWSNIH